VATKGHPVMVSCPACTEAGVRHSHTLFDPSTIIANHALQRMLDAQVTHPPHAACPRSPAAQPSC
jgi:hypothetical protein